MPTPARVASWKRHDSKRNGTPDRLMKERARGRVRSAAKRGDCVLCGETGATVWHHPDYEFPCEVQELCLKCHRAKHPRQLPQGGRA